MAKESDMSINKARNTIKNALLDHGVSIELISGRELDERARKLRQNIEDELDRRILAKPQVSLAIGAGVGFILGAMIF